MKKQRGIFSKFHHHFLIVLTVILFLTGATASYAVDVVLQWDANTDPDVAGYKVYYKADSSVAPFNGVGAVEGASPINVGNQTTASISGLDPAHSYFFTVTAYNSAGVESSYSNVESILLLSVTLAGSGSVNSNAGLSCLSGTCTSHFATGSPVTLLAAPSNTAFSLSYFSGWTGDCASTSGTSCSVTMNATKNISAVFNSYKPARILGGSYYSSLQTAYAAAANGGTLQAQSVTMAGNFYAGSIRNIILKGGYDATYSGRPGYTQMVGTLTVAQGSLTVDNLIIR